MTDALADARDLAFSALRDRAGNVSARLEALLGRCRLSQQDKALAGEIALGVVRRQATLQAVLCAFLANPDRALPGPLSVILQMGLYQLLLLDRVPDYAAVDEAVQQTARLGHKRKSGLVNGVLRSVTREVSPPQTGAPPLAGNVLPVGPNSYRSFSRPVFPDPAAAPVEYLAQAFSLSPSLAARWVERMGSLEGAAAVAMHANGRAPQILRVNTLRADVAKVLAALAEDGIDAQPHENGVSVVLAEHCHLPRLRVVTDALVQPQDATATNVVVQAEPTPGMKVLDFCAAPGTKTTHLAALMNNTGSIVAVDVSAEKLGQIEAGCRRMGVTIVTTHLADRAGELDPEAFDLVLADVPCSNTGVLARRAEARWRFAPEKLQRLARDQQMIAAAAARFVRPGGRLVYSTCSIEPEENGEVAHWLTSHEKRMKRVREETTVPGGADEPTRWHDGGYVAVFLAH